MENFASIRNIRILYVEDEVETRELVSRFLKNLGLQLDVAQNGEEGVALFHSIAPELVITDISMPVMSGLEMARAIRAEAPEVQLIFMTAYGDTANMLQAIDIGVSQFIVKPVDFDRLLTAISRCARQIRFRAEAQRVRQLESIGILAGGIAHDFNNLLQVMVGYISLAKMTVAADSRLYEYLELSETAAAEASELAGKILTFSKGGGIAVMKNESLVPILRDEVVAALEGSNVTAEFDLPATLPEVSCDISQIRQVVIHLTVNAMEAMPGGGGLLVSANSCRLDTPEKTASQTGAYLHIVFSDTGRGIPPEHLGKIFDPYFTTKPMDASRGQGLGLAVCHSIIQKHKGMISVESMLGKGTTIHLYLPVADAGES